MSGYRLLVQHAESCWFADGKQRAFVVYDGHEDRDRSGRRAYGSTWWHRFRCNDPKCQAVAIVRWDELADLIDAGLTADGQREGSSGV